MTNVFDHEVSVDEQGTRLDAFVASLGIDELASRSAAVRLIESGRILVNGQSTTKKRIVVAGDQVHIEIPPRSGEGGVIEAAYDIPLDIRYEDEHLIVLSKVSAISLRCRARTGRASCTGSTATRVASCSRLRPTWRLLACRMAYARATSTDVTSRSFTVPWVMTRA